VQIQHFAVSFFIWIHKFSERYVLLQLYWVCCIHQVATLLLIEVSNSSLIAFSYHCHFFACFFVHSLW